MSAKKLDLSIAKDKSTEILRGLRRYRLIIFIIMVAGVYGFVVWRIDSLDSMQPAQDAITAQTTSIGTIPHIDKTVEQQLEQLQDNSVSVKALFDQARNNPFQE